MMSAGVWGGVSALLVSVVLASVALPTVVSAVDGWSGLAGWTICVSAEASWNVEPIRGFARGVPSADLISDDLPSAGLADLAAATLLAAEIAAAASAIC